jgi:hypothetical protein
VVTVKSAAMNEQGHADISLTQEETIRMAEDSHEKTGYTQGSSFGRALGALLELRLWALSLPHDR